MDEENTNYDWLDGGFAVFEWNAVYERSHVTCHEWVKSHIPLTEEIRLQMFASRDLTIFSLDVLSDGDCVYTREKLV